MAHISNGAMAVDPKAWKMACRVWSEVETDFVRSRPSDGNAPAAICQLGFNFGLWEYSSAVNSCHAHMHVQLSEHASVSEPLPDALPSDGPEWARTADLQAKYRALRGPYAQTDYTSQDALESIDMLRKLIIDINESKSQRASADAPNWRATLGQK